MVVVMHIAVARIDENLAVNEIDVIAQPHLAQPLVQFLFGWTQSPWFVIVKRFRATISPEGRFSWPERRGQRRTHYSEALVCIWMSGIQLPELIDYRFEFAGRNIVILYLNMNAGGLA